jgi:hypothetical protein
MSRWGAAARSILLIFAWVGAAVGLYLALLGLEYYWNVPRWQPRFDWVGWVVAVWIVAVLSAVWFVAGATRNRVTLVVALIICLALMALAVYVFPAEPNVDGLFTRDSPSPLWYRSTRFFVLIVPGVLLGLRLAKQRSESGKEQKDKQACGYSP